MHRGARGTYARELLVQRRGGACIHEEEGFGCGEEAWNELLAPEAEVAAPDLVQHGIALEQATEHRPAVPFKLSSHVVDGAAAHTLAMVAAGAVLAVMVYRWFGLRAVSRTWFNLDTVWALSLLLLGLLSAAAVLWW